MRLAGLLMTLMVVFAGTATAVDVRVVGGERVSIDDHPWVVYVTDASGNQFCGGTLVSPTKVVTAAHCAAMRTPRNTRVVLGREDRQSSAGVVARLTDIWVHPDYVSADQGSDVAVLTLRDAVGFTSLPLARATDEELYEPGTSGLVLGWGRTSEQGSSSRYLMGATVPVMDDGHCENAYPQFDPDEMTCAGYPEGGVDTCQGDSGGPYVAGGRLIGITSWGEGCAREGKPGVYSEVKRYAEDIEAQLRI
ncbi:trypsin [Saccharothrix saharensis]|uniref:Trypsin n=1 Tax=Saccharothrix saharensis TaxID=571190 RepID=A0A543JKS5_9PSEU|nr:serine protease [Saccharothrix saharensis]TQM83440.1 trypsin [Saccharothrix saharensis]